jgi:GT2 family glycosyltransferase
LELKLRISTLLRELGLKTSLNKSADNSADQRLPDAQTFKQQGDMWGALRFLRDQYAINPTLEISQELSNLIGTQTPYPEIDAAITHLFDEAYYLTSNPDVRQATKDGLGHYLLYGWKENRNPSPFFDSAYYKSKNPRLAADIFPLAHFRGNGTNDTKGLANPVSDQYWFQPFVPSPEMWRTVPPARLVEDTEAVVVIPVYKGIEETLTSIYQALISRENQNYSLLVVNDKSPDINLNDTLKYLSELGLFDYHVSSVNRGFVQTCNFAIKSLSMDKDVVLLNSDAYVFAGWFNRLRAHALNESVATVTPLSNNATICSYPLPNRDNYRSLECAPSELDALASLANPGRAVETPTGVGFCFYITRNAIRAVGLLDEKAFKVGYGEENDFCMRALNLGYKNLVAGDVFVYHTGSVSFSAIKDDNFNKGQEALQHKHPNYNALVRAHIAADPERSFRRNLDAHRLISKMKGCKVFITHKWSGGIDTYLTHTREIIHAAGDKTLLIRVHDRHSITVETLPEIGPFVPNLSNIDLRTESLFIRDLLSDLEPQLIHINSFAGLEWVWHKFLLEIIAEIPSEKVFVGHDYSAISHHYQLLRPDNMFVGVPSLATRQLWSEMRDHSGSVDVCDPLERVETYSRFFESVSRLEVPSYSAQQIFQAEFPSFQFAVVYHGDHLPDTAPATRRQPDGRLRVAVVGAIGPHKGSEVLSSLAADARYRGLPIDYHLVGYSNNDELLQSCGVSITGHYQTELDALEKLHAIQPDIILVPSVWPETYCYTLSIALKVKIPPVVFDLGAQAERVNMIQWGIVLPYLLAHSPTELSEALLSLDVDDLWAKRTMGE